MSIAHPLRKPARLFAACLVATAGIAHGAPIGGTQITASTALGYYNAGFNSFTIDEIHDGIVSDAYPYNGYASGFGVTSGRITLTLDQSYDLDSFLLWNDVNIAAQGVRSFTLSFEDAAGGQLGTTATLTAISQFAPQTYSFASTVQGVRRVQMDVLSSALQIEIREVAFNGTASSTGTSVPEPGSLGLAFAALAAATVACRRARPAG
jgi:PEP-CTERM motif